MESLDAALHAAIALARQHHAAVLIVVDTLSAWSGMKADQENDAGSCEAVMSQFKRAASQAQVAVLVVHHMRKDGTVSRGSTALPAAADIVLTLAREDGGPSNRRCIKALSRYSDTPDSLTFDLNESEYELIRVPTGAARQHHAVFDVLPLDAPGATREELAEKSGRSQWQTRTAIKNLKHDGLVLVSGTGKNKDPFRYFRATQDPVGDGPP